MSVTTEQAGRPGQERPLQLLRPLGARKAPQVILLSLLLTGCMEQPLPQPPITREDCLGNVTLEDLPTALKVCDAVVMAFPQDPGPLNERYLLHTLAGNTAAACRDIAQASALAARWPKGKLDPILQQDLEVRQKSCTESRSPGRSG